MNEKLLTWIKRERALLRCNVDWPDVPSKLYNRKSHLLRERDDCLADILDVMDVPKDESETS